MFCKNNTPPPALFNFFLLFVVHKCGSKPVGPGPNLLPNRTEHSA